MEMIVQGVLFLDIRDVTYSCLLLDPTKMNHSF